MISDRSETVLVNLGGNRAVAIPRRIWEQARRDRGLAPGESGGVPVAIPEEIWREARQARGMEP